MTKEPFWNEIYRQVPQTLEKVAELPGVLSVFNSNIDAIVKSTPERFSNWYKSLSPDSFSPGKSPDKISTGTEFLQGFLHCFSRGVAMERLITDESLFKQIHKLVGYDHLQMGGQGGIIGNVMSAAGIKNVLVHAASLPKEQSSLFLDNENLKSALQDGTLKQASKIERSEDIPLIHWILEFKKGDVIIVEGEEYRCPKSNRFIATWDPLNFRLALDPGFVIAVNNYNKPITHCLLSGYQMLTEPLADGSSALDRIKESKESVDQWRKNRDMTVHFEFASTQDITVRKMLLTEMASWADSIGLNEQELIDLLDVIGEGDLAQKCREELDPASLTKGLITLFKQCKMKRIQLHFFGCYITIRQNSNVEDAEKTLKGMALAATCAASKAAAGAIDTNESLLYAVGSEIKGEALKAFSSVTSFMKKEYKANSFGESGIYSGGEFELIAVPTIIVDNPVTLVGMGDTISSLSLVGSI